MTTDGPAALRRIADLLFTISQDGAWSDAVDLASQWQAEREQAAADRAVLAQARALLPEELVECVWNGRGYERCGCANVDKDNHCMYCLYPPWAHDLAATLGGAR